MTSYTGNDLGEGWEFKILRANTRAFKDAARMKRVCDEEGQNGWTLLEKLDDSRLRFKRSAKARDGGPVGAIDPYRTHFGMDPTKLALVIVGIILTFFLVVLMIVKAFN